MRDLKIFILVLAVSASVLMVAGLGFSDETAPPADGGASAVMANTSGVAPAPAPLATYSTPPAQ